MTRFPNRVKFGKSEFDSYRITASNWIESRFREEPAFIELLKDFYLLLPFESFRNNAFQSSSFSCSGKIGFYIQALQIESTENNSFVCFDKKAKAPIVK